MTTRSRTPSSRSSAAETRTPYVDNEVVRRFERYFWLTEFGESIDPVESMAPDLVIEDRRTGVSIGQLRGVDAAIDNMEAQDELFGPTTFAPIAVRGEHLALFRTRALSDSGFELVSLGIVEIDDTGQTCAMTFFDDDDLAHRARRPRRAVRRDRRPGTCPGRGGAPRPASASSTGRTGMGSRPFSTPISWRSTTRRSGSRPPAATGS